MRGRTVQTNNRRPWGMAVRLRIVAVFCLVWQMLPAPSAAAQTAAQKGQQLINRNTQFLFNTAHTGAKFTSMQSQGITPTAKGGFDLTYRMTWISSLTNNQNTTDWTFEFEKNGRFRGFRLSTTWPTGGFELADLGIAALRDYFLKQDAVRNDANWRQAIQHAPNAAQLTALWLQIDQKFNP